MIPRGASAIVVNDDASQLRLVGGLLEGWGMRVRGFTDSTDALHALQEEGPVDLVVVDLHMPGIDGWKFCRILRSEEFPELNAVPVLVISATFSGAEVEAVTAQLGANAFLPVPFRPKVLREYVEAILAGERPRYVPTVLIVDDDAGVRGSVGKVFVNGGYRVYLAPDGKEGHRLYARVRPDVVVLDYHLPDLTGEALLESIKRPGDPAVVLVITGDADPQLALSVLRKGADGYVRKPFDAQYLVSLADRARRERALLRVEELLEVRTQELRASEERYRTLFSTIPDPVVQVSPDGILLQANDAGLKLFGLSAADLGRKDMRGLVVGGEGEAVLQALRRVWRTGSGSFEVKVKDGAGEVRHLEVRARTVGHEEGGSLLLAGRDVTERRQMEEEKERLQSRMQHAQKLESLGVMAGGIAHDFNNLLVGILGNASLVLMDLDRDHPAYESVQQIEVAARRAAELTGQILTYSGKRKPTFEEVHLSELVREMSQLMEPAVSKKATLMYDLSPRAPTIRGDAGQIRQVVMNLIMNASDALEGEAGTITVRVRAVDAGPALLWRSYLGQDHPPGRYVALEVSDTGCGMDEETLGRIFDPFFTTKATGRGLGLASTLGIVRSHGGAILVDTKPGEGTTFCILFPEGGPKSGRSVVEQPVREKEGEAPDDGGVLLVDDEDAVRGLASAVLRRMGVRVYEARDGEEGYRIFRAHRRRIDAALLDLTMPGMTGREVLDALRRIAPGLPVILSSGYTEETALEGIEEDPRVMFLRKPYTPEGLRVKILEALRRARELSTDGPLPVAAGD